PPQTGSRPQPLTPNYYLTAAQQPRARLLGRRQVVGREKRTAPLSRARSVSAKRSDSACTVRADGDPAFFGRKLRTMADQEALHAGELVVLFGQNPNGELFVQ